MDETILTLAELKQYLGIAAGDTSKDAQLTPILAALAPWLLSVTGTWFGSAKTQTETQDLADVVFTKYMPVTAITSIKTGYSNDHTDTGLTTLTNDQYRWNAEGRIVLDFAYDTIDNGRMGYDQVQLVYTHGIVPTPQPVKEAAKIFAAGLYNTNTAGGKEITSEAVGSYRKTYTTSTLQTTLLEPWIIIKL